MKKILERLPRWFKVFIVIVIASAFLWQISPDYYMVQPGTILEISENINVDSNGQKFGNLFLTTVSQSPTNGLTFLYSFIHPAIELQPQQEVIPPEMDLEEYRKMMQQYMEDSQNMAKVVALETLGHDIEFTGEGIRVIEFSEGSPAKGILEVGDVITEIDGEEVYLAENMVSIIEQYPGGEEVELTVKRGNYTLSKTVTPDSHPDDGDKSFLGIYIQTEKWEPVLPVEISIETGRIGGPSAGLMFALEIINQITDGDLTQGQKIAGTGAIDLNGNVNTVGGIRHKVKAAEAEGANYFLVPGPNYNEALNTATEIKVIEINSVNEAKEFLEAL